MSSGKISERKKDLKQVRDSDELRNASVSKPQNVTEIDLSFNQIE